MEVDSLIRAYIAETLESGSPPKSVHAFCKKLEIDERAFYEKFGSFESLEGEIWRRSVAETIQTVESSEEWSGFNAQQKLLTFLYAFTDRVLEQRSFYLLRFPRARRGRVTRLCPELEPMRSAFVEFADRIVSQGRESGEIACRGALNRTYPQGLLAHFLSVIEFNLEDTSQGFQRTDAFIEKSVKLAFDLVGSQALDSAFDLVRFLTGRNRPASSNEPS